MTRKKGFHFPRRAKIGNLAENDPKFEWFFLMSNGSKIGLGTGNKSGTLGTSLQPLFPDEKLEVLCQLKTASGDGAENRAQGFEGCLMKFRFLLLLSFPQRP